MLVGTMSPPLLPRRSSPSWRGPFCDDRYPAHAGQAKIQAAHGFADQRVVVDNLQGRARSYSLANTGVPHGFLDIVRERNGVMSRFRL